MRHFNQATNLMLLYYHFNWTNLNWFNSVMTVISAIQCDAHSIHWNWAWTGSVLVRLVPQFVQCISCQHLYSYIWEWYDMIRIDSTWNRTIFGPYSKFEIFIYGYEILKCGKLWNYELERIYFRIASLSPNTEHWIFTIFQHLWHWNDGSWYFLTVQGQILFVSSSSLSWYLYTVHSERFSRIAGISSV